MSDDRGNYSPWLVATPCTNLQPLLQPGNLFLPLGLGLEWPTWLAGASEANQPHAAAADIDELHHALLAGIFSLRLAVRAGAGMDLDKPAIPLAALEVLPDRAGLEAKLCWQMKNSPLEPGSLTRGRRSQKRSAFDEGNVADAGRGEIRGQRAQADAGDGGRRDENIVPVIERAPTIAAALVDGP